MQMQKEKLMFVRATKGLRSILINSEKLDGKPIIVGTRISIEMILRALEQCGTIGKVIECYPQLTAEQIKEAIYFSRRVLEEINNPKD